MDIGILGFGTLGRALAAGLRTHPDVTRIAATTRTTRPQSANSPDVILLTDNRELAAASDIILLCVKPAQLESVVKEIAEDLRENTLIISAVAAIETALLHAWLGENARSPIVRVMPNMPCRIGAGMTAITPGPNSNGRHLEQTKSLFETLGRVCTVEERLMDAVTAISGCGPAYVYLIIEALSEAGVKLGLPRPIAQELAAQTLQGSAAMVLSTQTHPAALKDEVTTPAGCTIDGLLALEDGGLRSTLIRAVSAAAHRSQQLR